MQTFTVGGPRRWPFHGLGRNELLRWSDRVESIAVVIVAVVAILAIPFAVDVGASVHEFEVEEQAVRSASVHQETATVIAAPRDTAASQFSSEWSVPVRWDVGGVAGYGTVLSEVDARVGDRLPIWLDESGNLTTRPVAGSAVADAIGVGVVVWLAFGGAGTGLLALLRWWLDVGRFARWERELNSLADDGGGRTRR